MVVDEVIGFVGDMSGAEVGEGVGGEIDLTDSAVASGGVSIVGVISGVAAVGTFLGSEAIRLVPAREKSSDSSSFSTSLISTRLLDIIGDLGGSDDDNFGGSCVFVAAVGFGAVVDVVDDFVAVGFVDDAGAFFNFASSSLTALLAGSIVSAVSKSFLASSTLPSDRRAIPRLQRAFTFLLSSFNPNVQSRSASANLRSIRDIEKKFVSGNGYRDLTQVVILIKTTVKYLSSLRSAIALLMGSTELEGSNAILAE